MLHAEIIITTPDLGCSMSLAAETREAVRERPVLYDALRAGIVNYTAAAERLALNGDREAIATALRRFAESLSENADEPH
jgi:hypothetical protein